MKSEKNNHEIQSNYSNVCVLWNFFQCQHNFSNSNVNLFLFCNYVLQRFCSCLSFFNYLFVCLCF